MASIAKRTDGKYRARYRDATGREHARHFARKIDAQRWLDEVTASVVTGQYVDPRAGKVTFRDYAEQWRAGQVHRPSSQAHIETMLRRHAYPTLGDRPLSSILPSEVQALGQAAWHGAGSRALAPATVGGRARHRVVGLQGRRAGSADHGEPVRGHAPSPSRSASRSTPPTTEQVEALRDAIAPSAARRRDVHGRHRTAAGRGVRTHGGPADMLRRRGHRRPAARQDRPGSRRASARRRQRRACARSRSPRSSWMPSRRTSRQFPARAGRTRLHARSVKPMNRQAFGRLWRPAARSAGIPDGTGLHLSPALLRVTTDPVRREREDRPGAARARHRGGHARHLQPPLAGLRRPHEASG